MESLYLWGRSIQEIGGDVVIGRSIYGVVVIDGSLYSDSTVCMICCVANVMLIAHKFNTHFQLQQYQFKKLFWTLWTWKFFAHYEHHNIVSGIGLASHTRPANLILQGDCAILVLNLHVHLNWNELASLLQSHGEHRTDGNGLNVGTEPPLGTLKIFTSLSRPLAQLLSVSLLWMSQYCRRVSSVDESLTHQFWWRCTWLTDRQNWLLNHVVSIQCRT